MNRVRTWLLATLLLLPFSAAFGQFYDALELPIPQLTNSAQTIRSTPGVVLYYNCYNPNTTTAWLQFYDTASAVTVGTTTPTFSVAIGPNGATGPSSMGKPGSVSTTYSATNALQVAATTTATGATGPTTPLSCAFGYR